MISEIKNLQDKKHPQRIMYIGLIFYILINLIGLSFYLFKLFRVQLGYEDPYTQYLNVGGTGFEYILMMFVMASCIPLMYPIEKNIIRSTTFRITKLNIIALIGLVIPYIFGIISGNRDLATYLAIPGLVLAGILFLFAFLGCPILYIKLGLQAVGNLRIKCLSTGFGLFMICIGIIIAGLPWPDNIFYIPHIVMLFGTILTMRGYKMEV